MSVKEASARPPRLGLASRLNAWWRHHRSEARDSLRRMLAAPLPSFMTWAVIAIALSLPVGLFVGLQNLQQLSSGWDRALQISLYLRLDLAEQAGRDLRARLAQREDVAEAVYIAKAEALAEFQQRSGLGEVLEYLDDNPLPAVIVIVPNNPDQDLQATRQLLAELQSLEEVDQAQLDMEWVQRLYSIMELGRRAVLVLGALLAGAVLLVIGNTIRLAVESRREEIVVIKLVGGTDAFVRRPFLYMGLWYGFGGALLAWTIVAGVLLWLDAPVTELAATYHSDFDLRGLGLINSLLLFCLSAFLGLVGARVAVGRHLKALEPA